MKKYFSLAVFALLMILGCQKSSTEIVLDNNSKWVVNSEMVPHITAMETNIRSFQEGDDITILQNRLKEDLSGLTSKCTMTGQSHDELHKWLVPFMETVSTMNEKNATSIIEDLKRQIDNYHLYFESAS